MSYYSGYDGGSCCGDHDSIIGGDGTDTATVNAEDSVSTVEDITAGESSVHHDDGALHRPWPKFEPGSPRRSAGFSKCQEGTGTRRSRLVFTRIDSPATGSQTWYFDSGPASRWRVSIQPTA